MRHSPREIKRKYKKYRHRANEQELQFKPKIDKLYQEFTALPDGDLKRLIQWGLTYFFADMDLISDDIPIYGLVDDMIVIDIVLKILDPSTFPTAKSEVPFRAETRLTNISGAEVPAATMVRPITISGTCIPRAKEEAPSVSLSAPHNTRATPTMI